MVVLDHVASVPAVIEPVKELAELVKKHAPGADVLVDGALSMVFLFFFPSFICQFV